MTSPDTRGVTIIAEWQARQLVLLWFLLGWLLGSVVVAGAASSVLRITHLWAKHDPIAIGVILAVVLIGGCFRGWRIGLRIDESGVTIRNFFRTHRISWREVYRFADGSLPSFEKDQPYAYWALRVVLRDEPQTAPGAPSRSSGRQSEGRAVTARGTLAGEFARPETLTAIKQAAERYGTPAELTGIPWLRDGFWTRLRDRRRR